MSFWSKKEARLAVQDYEIMTQAAANAYDQNAFNRIDMFGASAAQSKMYGNQYAQQPKEQPPAVVGQLLWRGNELPHEWRGAHYDLCTRSLEGDRYPHWKLTFTSSWADTPIYAYFSAQKYSGDEIDTLAETLREVINQRRLG